MFEVNVDGKQYRISFKYFEGFSDDVRDEFNTIVRYTRVKLERIVDGEKIAVAHADTACSTTEQFDKNEGRKRALTRLMDTDRETLGMSPVDAEQYIRYKRSLPSGDWRVIHSVLDMPDFDSKTVRWQFWAEYFGRQVEDRSRNRPPHTDPWPERVTTWVDKIAAEFVQQGVERAEIA